jgi:predicted nucleotidyltransferase
MQARLDEIVAEDPRIAYAIVFGSVARAAARGSSDLDLAIGLLPGAVLAPLELGALSARIEAARGRPVDLVVVDEAPPPLAYRIFRDGCLVFERDHAVQANHRAKAILEYLDFRPIEELCARGVLAAAARGR